MKYNHAYSKLFPNNCPVSESTADGVPLGPCTHYIGKDRICPHHGKIPDDLETNPTHPMKLTPELLKAAKNADWMQVVYNQGPPCFHLENSRFCLRAERWDGHWDIGSIKRTHEFVSLENLLQSLNP